MPDPKKTDKELDTLKSKVEGLVNKTLEAEKAAGNVPIQRPEESPEHFQKEIDKLAKSNPRGKEAIQAVLKDHENDKDGWAGRGVLREYIPHKDTGKTKTPDRHSEIGHNKDGTVVALSPEIEAIKRAVGEVKMHNDQHTGPATTGNAGKNAAAKAIG